MTHFRQLALAGLSTAVAALATTTNASADSVRGFGSLLVYPIVDNTRADLTLLSLTNHSNSTSVVVEYVYINAVDCLETNRTRTLTPNDTITVDARVDSGAASGGNTAIANGYCYVFAKNAAGQAISFNNLSGSAVVLEGGVGSSYSPDPIIYRAIPAQGAQTNIDNDVYRDLNGTEYEQTSDEIHIPHFISAGNFEAVGSNPELVLLSLTGGQSFQAVVNFLVYNDNEEPFSAQANFRCWRRSALTAYSGIFANSFLATTNDAANESTLGFETGWYKVDGNVTSSGSSLPGGTATDPALIAVHINRVGAGAEQTAWVVPSYGVGEQNNGDLQAAVGNLLD
ncbi:MAG: hypothetical protein RL112_1087 [Planctomycetota bacterium]|jgi:hypothetical protein